MLLVDRRAGSKDLVAPLRKAGLPVEVTTLDFGDVAFIGRGEGGEELAVGIEHKTVADAVQSLDSRLPGHQLPGMVQDYGRAYLLIEGERPCDSQGRMLRRSSSGMRPMQGAPTAIEFEKRLLVMSLRAGITVRFTKDQAETVRFITALYRTWTDKDLDEHKSHLAIHNPDLDRQLLVPISPQRQAFAAWPGISLERSKAVEAHFGKSLRRSVLAPLKEWAALETNGRKFGEKSAQKLLDFFDGK